MPGRAMAMGTALTAFVAAGSAAQVPCANVGDAGVHACVYEGGSPMIVLAAGAGQDSRTWAPVIDELTSLGTIVTFDRPGFGRSPAAEGARTPTAIATEIRDLLAALDIRGPVYMVGHSMGGVHALRFADLFPESVAGVLLLDTPPPDFEQERMLLLSSGEREQRLALLEQGRARGRPAIGLERDGAAAEPWLFPDLPAGIPLIVAVADRQNFGDLGSEEAHRRLWLELSERWLDLSTRSELRVVHGSSHMVHVDRPDTVIDLVRGLIASGGDARAP